MLDVEKLLERLLRASSSIVQLRIVVSVVIIAAVVRIVTRNCAMLKQIQVVLFFVLKHDLLISLYLIVVRAWTLLMMLVLLLVVLVLQLSGKLLLRVYS